MVNSPVTFYPNPSLLEPRYEVLTYGWVGSNLSSGITQQQQKLLPNSNILGTATVQCCKFYIIGKKAEVEMMTCLGPFLKVYKEWEFWVPPQGEVTLCHQGAIWLHWVDFIYLFCLYVHNTSDIWFTNLWKKERTIVPKIEDSCPLDAFNHVMSVGFQLVPCKSYLANLITCNINHGLCLYHYFPIIIVIRDALILIPVLGISSDLSTHISICKTTVKIWYPKPLHAFSWAGLRQSAAQRIDKVVMLNSPNSFRVYKLYTIAGVFENTSDMEH